jgi:hypothetical protein
LADTDATDLAQRTSIQLFAKLTTIQHEKENPLAWALLEQGAIDVACFGMVLNSLDLLPGRIYKTYLPACIPAGEE